MIRTTPVKVRYSVNIKTELFKGYLEVLGDECSTKGYIFGRCKEILRTEHNIIMPYGYEGFDIIKETKFYEKSKELNL